MILDKSDKDILDSVIGGIVLREMTGITFLHWVSAKLNGVKTYTAANQELIQLIKNPPLSRLMPEEEKLRIFKKLQEIIETPLL